MTTTIDIIKEKLEAKKKKNSLYSLRGFAKQLGISPAHLSQILNKKRPLTLKTANKIANSLSLSPIEKEKFLDALNTDQINSLKEAELTQERLTLAEDEFRLISDWEHFAILSLSELPKNSYDSRWIAKRLNIDMAKATQARDRLVRMGILQKKGKGFIQIAPPLTTTQDILDQSIQKNHIQNLHLAAQRLEEVSLEHREFTSVTFASNPKKIKEAKQMIRNFKRKLTRFLEDTDKLEVYTLAIQLFPLTNTEDK